MSKNYANNILFIDPLNNYFNESVNKVFFYKRQIGDMLENEWERDFKEDQFSIMKTQGNIKSQIVIAEINENQYVILEKLVNNGVVKIDETHVINNNFKMASNNFKRYIANHQAYFNGEPLILK